MMGHTVIISNLFKKDFQCCIKRGLDMKLMTLLFLETGTHADLSSMEK